MTRKDGKERRYPEKSMLSEECQLLLEEIFAFFHNREEAKKDPDLCIEAMLTKIQMDLADHPITATLQLTLDRACNQGVPAFVREYKKKGEYSHFEMTKMLKKEA